MGADAAADLEGLEVVVLAHAQSGQEAPSAPPSRFAMAELLGEARPLMAETRILRTGSPLILALRARAGADSARYSPNRLGVLADNLPPPRLTVVGSAVASEALRDAPDGGAWLDVAVENLGGPTLLTRPRPRLHRTPRAARGGPAVPAPPPRDAGAP